MMLFISRLTFSVALLLLVGFLQIIGFIISSDDIRNLGRLTSASPLPLVFSDFRGLETFSLEFKIEAESVDGLVIEKLITPKLYGSFPGPYNRRNVYGAVLAYGPKLVEPSEKPLVESVLRYGFCKNGPLSAMFDLKSELKSAMIFATSKAQTDGGTYVTEVTCQ